MADAETPLNDSRPILTFAQPDVLAIPKVTGRSFPRFVTPPSPGRQGVRITPQFNVLQEAFASRRMDLSDATPEGDPELVAVIDLVGAVDDFYKAASKIPGLEFLFDVEREDVEADEDFHYVDGHGDATDKDVPQHLYMVMSNAEALGELIRLFELWTANKSVKFEMGLNPLKGVFALIRTIRRWEAADRIRETGLLEQWRESADIASTQSMQVEIELWYRNDPVRRQDAHFKIETALEQSDGRIVSSSVIPEIRYHGLLAEIPRAAVENVLERGASAIEFLTVEGVMFAHPVPQHGFAVAASIGEAPSIPDAKEPSGLPQVALLDGVPLGNHLSLAGRLIIDDPDDVESRYQATQRRHGTAMASLIVHGPLDAGGAPLVRPVYVHPILEPDQVFVDQEVFSASALFIDTLNRALRRVLDSESWNEDTTREIRIVNLSIGDPSKIFVRRMSPQARLIDWFSHRYNVLIVVSAGNHEGDDISFEVPSAVIANEGELHSEVLRASHSAERGRRLLAPAEAINAITVGASHSDGMRSLTLPDHLKDPLHEGMPATYSSVGFGYRRAVKPEILLPGGRLLYGLPSREVDVDKIRLQPAIDVEVAGLAVAAPGLRGELNGRALTFGTSNSAALATRSLARIFEAFETEGAIDGELPDAELHPVMAKALLIHAASWGLLKSRVIHDFELSGNGMRHKITQYLGYGVVSEEHVATATSSRVVLLGGSKISKGMRHQYRFPLPGALHASAEWRRLTVTLAWISAVNPSTQKYRVARLSFGDVRDALAVGSHEADGRATTRGTVQHEVFEGRKAAVFSDGDSIVIDVDCRIDAGSSSTETRYGIVASLEVGATVRADIHSQVRQLLQTNVEVPVRERIRP